MIKLKVRASSDKVLDLIDSKLKLLMAMENLRLSPPITGLSGATVSEKVGSISYFDRGASSASLAFVAAPEHNTERAVALGMLVKNTGEGATCELYLDRFARMMALGVIPASRPLVKIIVNIFVVGVVLVALPFFWWVAFLIPILYLVQHFWARRKFKQQTAILERVSSVFEAELPVIEKSASNDFLSFWGRIKGDVEDHLRP